MLLRHKLYITTAIIITILFAGGFFWSRYEIGKLESSVVKAGQLAEIKAREANEKEKEAAAFRQKLEYLEKNLSEIRQTAKKQDDEIEIFTKNVAAARSDAHGARRIRSIAANADELCRHLARLGHPCE